MKYLLCIYLIVFLQFAAVGQPESLLRSEQIRFTAQVERDTQILDRLLDDDLLYIHSNGLQETKRDFIESVASGSIVYSSMSPVAGAHRITRLGRKHYLIQNVVDVAGQYRGKAFDIQLWYTSVYRKRRGVWQLLTWQSLKVE